MAQLIKKFSICYGNQRLITVLERRRHWSLPTARRILYMYTQFLSQYNTYIHTYVCVCVCVCVCVGRDSSVGIANRYGLDGPGIESRQGRDYPHPSRPALGPIQPPIQWVPGLSRG